MSKIATETLHCLTEAGWFVGRHTDVEPYRLAYQSEGFEFPNVVEDFLKEFGGLIIRYKTHLGSEDIIHFLAHEAVEGMGGCMEFYERRIGERLFPIGHFWAEHYVLMMGVSGKIYSAFDSIVAYLGEGITAIDNLITISNIEVL